MVPERLLLVSHRDGAVVPHFLGPHDHLWLQALLDEHARFAGRPRRELDERLRDRPSCPAPPGKLRLAVHVLRRVWPTQRPSGVRPNVLRAAVFLEAARSLDDPTTVLRRVAAQRALSVASLQERLFADLPGEWLVGEPPPSLDPLELSLRVNLVLAQGLLFRAIRVGISGAGNVRRVVRLAKLQGLICTVHPHEEPELSISGPYALFRRTLVYGRALAALVPALAWCPGFRLDAECLVAGRSSMFRLRSGAPIFPGPEPTRFDSLVEERFARDFARLAPQWNVLREPEAVPAGGALVFPDFALEHRHDGRRWLVEILGFWSPDYVTRKLAGLRAASIPNLLLCIAEDRNCAESELPSLARVVRYRRRIDAAAVLRVIEQASL